jgi:hypothetical protein
MAALLTKKEISAYYDMLIHKPGYIKSFKKRINKAKREQVLTYAREVNREAILRIERENGFFHHVKSYNFPPCPLSTNLLTLPNGIKLDTFTYKDQLKYWLVTSGNVIRILEGSIKKKPKNITTLEDACKGDKELEFLKAWFVKMRFCDPHTFAWSTEKKGAKKSLSGYLKDLHKKNYSVKLGDQEIKDIAKNSFSIVISIDTVKHSDAGCNTIPLPAYSDNQNT